MEFNISDIKKYFWNSFSDILFWYNLCKASICLLNNRPIDLAEKSPGSQHWVVFLTHTSTDFTDRAWDVILLKMLHWICFFFRPVVRSEAIDVLTLEPSCFIVYSVCPTRCTYKCSGYTAKKNKKILPGYSDLCAEQCLKQPFWRCHERSYR